MGTILSCHCHECGYQEKLYVGGGLLDCNPDTALRAAPDEPSLTKALQVGARFQIDREVAVCRKCRRLFAAPYVTYWPPDDKARYTAAACPVCRHLLTRLNRQTTSVPCPSCGKVMKLFPCGHWD